MLGPWDPEMPETQPLPFGAHDLVGKQRCAEEQFEARTPCFGRGRVVIPVRLGEIGGVSQEGRGDPAEWKTLGMPPKAGGAGGSPGWDVREPQSGAGRGSTRGSGETVHLACPHPPRVGERRAGSLPGLR